MRLYVAGPLFTQAERAWNERLAAALSAAGHDVFLPQTEVKAIATLDADLIFKVDIDGVRSAEAVVAILDGADPDSGTSFECGLAYALGIPIVALRTDFRAGGDALPNQKLATINLMLAQSSSAIVNLVDPSTSFETMAASVVSALAGLSTTDPVSRFDRGSNAGSW